MAIGVPKSYQQTRKTNPPKDCNNRNLLTDVDYSDSTLDVHYGYGEYGERTVMEEKSGGSVVASTSYAYDTYKRLQTETRTFQGLGGSYSVSYAYNVPQEF